MDKKTKVKKTIPDTICRVHRSGGYAVLSNCFVRSTNIGCDSIGLLGKINDLQPAWNFTIAGLVAICEDGETAIKSQLAELEQWGYVKKTLLMRKKWFLRGFEAGQFIGNLTAAENFAQEKTVIQQQYDKLCEEFDELQENYNELCEDYYEA